MKAWIKIVDNLKNPKKEITFTLVGKYSSLPDVYISVVEALKSACGFYKAKVNIKWIEIESLN